MGALQHPQTHQLLNPLTVQYIRRSPVQTRQPNQIHRPYIKPLCIQHLVDQHLVHSGKLNRHLINRMLNQPAKACKSFVNLPNIRTGYLPFAPRRQGHCMHILGSVNAGTSQISHRQQIAACVFMLQSPESTLNKIQAILILSVQPSRGWPAGATNDDRRMQSGPNLYSRPRSP